MSEEGSRKPKGVSRREFLTGAASLIAAPNIPTTGIAGAAIPITKTPFFIPRDHGAMLSLFRVTLGKEEGALDSALEKLEFSSLQLIYELVNSLYNIPDSQDLRYLQIKPTNEHRDDGFIAMLEHEIKGGILGETVDDYDNIGQLFVNSKIRTVGELKNSIRRFIQNLISLSDQEILNIFGINGRTGFSVSKLKKFAQTCTHMNMQKAADRIKDLHLRVINGALDEEIDANKNSGEYSVISNFYRGSLEGEPNVFYFDCQNKFNEENFKNYLEDDFAKLGFKQNEKKLFEVTMVEHNNGKDESDKKKVYRVEILDVNLFSKLIDIMSKK